MLAVCQGTTSVVPFVVDNGAGFSPCALHAVAKAGLHNNLLRHD
jgi:hypothetical protein